MSPDSALESLLGRYLDGIHRGDVALLAELFHPDAHLYTVHGGYAATPLAGWLERVAARPSPHAQGEVPSGRILATDRSGADTAFAKVTLRVGALLGTDYLTLLRVDGAWRIVSKTFHVEAA